MPRQRPTAFIIHWSAAEMPGKVSQVEAAGWRVVGTEDASSGRAEVKVGSLQPDVLAFWTSRLPSRGRNTALLVRANPKSRHVPVVFVHNDPNPLDPVKADAMRDAIPDALWATPAELKAVLQRALARRPAATAKRTAAARA